MVVGSPIVLNLVPGGVMKMVHVNQADKNIDIQFQIMNGNQPYNIPEGWTGTIRGTKGDAFGYSAAVTVTAGSNVVTVHLKEQLTAVAGVGNIFELVFASTSAKVSTENFILAVERSALNDETVISESDLVYANQVLNQLQSVAAVNQQVQQNKANIATETATRAAADTTLQNNINTEAAARQAADQTLQSNINAEASTRATADASLQSQIDQLVAPSGEAPSAAEVLNARIGADGVTYPTLGDAIRTNDTNLKSHLNEFRDGFTNLNVFVYANLLSDSGYVAVADGKIIVNDNAAYSTYILRVDGVSKYTFTNCRFAVLVGSDRETAIGSVLSDVTQIQSTGATYIAFSFNHNDYPVASYQVSKGETLETGYVLPDWYESDVAQKIADATGEIDQDIAAVHEEVVDLKNALAVEVTESGTETLATTGFSTGLMDLSGNVITGGAYDNYKYSASIPVVPGDVFRGVTFRFVTAFSNGVAVSERGGNSVSSYTVPDGIDAVVVSVSDSVASFTHDYTRTVLKPIGSNSVSLDKNVLYKTGKFTNGGLYNFILMTLAKASISKRFVAIFECDCVSGTDFEYGFSVSGASPANAKNNVITITSTKISYNGTDYTHGITIEGRIKLIVEQLTEGNVKVTLMANGNTYSTTFSYELTTTCSPYVMSDGLIANNCKLTFTCRDLQKKIWIFGDSYCSYNSARWRYYLHEYGYDENAFINAHSGAGSVNAITALNNLIKIGYPEYIVWAIGMNDGSDSNASAPASAWVTGRDSLLAICENYNITPIFCTIPNVPTVSNAGKNAWIKASGYKYIDLCHAVGADETTAWLGNMLSNDGVHPSVTGAKALFAQVVADFPEITINV